jgi:hypothetical protein
MARANKRCWLLVILALGVLILPGCGSGATLQGTVTFPPEMQLNDNDSVLISFVPEDLKGPTFPAVFLQGANSFVAEGVAKKGLLPGRYKIVVEVHPYPGRPDSAERSAFFAQFNQSYMAGVTPLNYEVTPESTQTITIDLVHRTVTKN